MSLYSGTIGSEIFSFLQFSDFNLYVCSQWLLVIMTATLHFKSPFSFCCHSLLLKGSTEETCTWLHKSHPGSPVWSLFAWMDYLFPSISSTLPWSLFLDLKICHSHIGLLRAINLLTFLSNTYCMPATCQALFKVLGTEEWMVKGSTLGVYQIPEH